MRKCDQLPQTRHGRAGGVLGPETHYVPLGHWHGRTHDAIGTLPLTSWVALGAPLALWEAPVPSAYRDRWAPRWWGRFAHRGDAAASARRCWSLPPSRGAWRQCLAVATVTEGRLGLAPGARGRGRPLGRRR